MSMVSITWQDDELTRAIVTCHAGDHRWWRKRYVRAEVMLSEDDERLRDNTSLVFVATGVRVCDDDDGYLARDIWKNRQDIIRDRKWDAHRRAIAAKGNPWTAVEPLPRARVVEKS